MVILQLTEKEATAVHAALVHARREFLDCDERKIVNDLADELRQFDKPLSTPQLRAFARRGKLVEVSRTTSTRRVYLAA